MSISLRLAVAGIGIVLAGASALAAEPAAPARLISQADVIGISVKQSLVAMATGANATIDLTTVESIERGYEQHGNVPFWVDGSGYNAKARQVLDEMKRASDWGLSSNDYAVPVLKDAGITNAKLADAELVLTVAAVKYARDAHVGRFDPSRISEMIDVMSTPPNPAAVLNGLASATDPAGFLVSFNPRHPEFEQLRQKYLALRGNQPGTGPVRIPDGPRLRRGDTSADIPLIRQRLQVSLAAGSDPQFYDDALAAAIKEFQTNGGYRNDGVITSSTRRALNGQLQAAPAKGTQIEKILANMERWRWVPEDLGNVYIQNNLPEFVTRVVKNGQVIHTTRVVVGKPEFASPIFSKKMTYAEFNPFWRVPDSIKVNDLLPSILSRGNGVIAGRGLKLSQNGKEVNASSINFASTSIRNYDVFQPPGPGNALGKVKFMFPNRFSVYMHDTPSKDLFASSSRAFSHGCVRVQNPEKFAEVILAEANGWSPEKVQAEFAQSENKQVQFDRPIPVHMTYFTVRVGADGQLQFFDDVYGNDRRTILAMAGKWSQVDKQLEPKAAPESDILAKAGVSRSDGGGNIASAGGGTFADVFGVFDNSSSKKKKRARRDSVRVINGGGANSGFVKSGPPKSQNFFDLFFN